MKRLRGIDDDCYVFCKFGGQYPLWSLGRYANFVIGALATCVQYGQYIMGADLFLAVLASAMFWIGLKATAGLLIFIWKLLPLT